MIRSWLVAIMKETYSTLDLKYLNSSLELT